MSDIRKSIGWADWSSNEVWGCLHNCPYCYARSIAKRFGRQIARNELIGRSVSEEEKEILLSHNASKLKNFIPTWIQRNFEKRIPKSAKHIFVNSMSDVVFWKKEWLVLVYEKAKMYPDKKFLFLTKDPVRFTEIQADLNRDGVRIWGQNLYFGFSITGNENILNVADNDYDFISIEPLHKRIDFLKLPAVKQIIVGAETGNRKEKIIPETEWIEEIKKWSELYGIKLFEKDSLKTLVSRSGNEKFRDLVQQKI